MFVLILYSPTPQNGQAYSNNCLSVFDHFAGLALKELTKLTAPPYVALVSMCRHKLRRL